MHRGNLRKLGGSARHERNKKHILLAFGLGICEGIGEDSGHGISHVDIRVGSCNFLDVIVCHGMCT